MRATTIHRLSPRQARFWCDGTGGVRPTSPIKPTHRIHPPAYHSLLDAMVQARPYGRGKGARLAPATVRGMRKDWAKFASLAGVLVSWVMLASARRERRRLPLHLWVVPRGTNAGVKRQDRRWMHSRHWLPCSLPGVSSLCG